MSTRPQREETSCGVCSGVFCAHGVCRVCGSCSACEGVEIPARASVAVDCLCIPGCSINGECPVHGDHGHHGAARIGKPFDLIRNQTPAILTEVRLTRTMVSSEPRDLAERVRYLRSMGVASEDMADASRALDDRRSDCCGCLQWKRSGESFCGDCWHILPSRLHARLKQHVCAGYLEAVRESWKLLQGRWAAVQAGRAAAAKTQH